MDSSTVITSSSDLPYQDLEYGIKWNRIVLQMSGIWPAATEQSRMEEFLTDLRFFLILVSGFTILIIPQTTSLIMVWGDLDLIVDNLATNVPFITAMVKLFVTRWNKKALIPIVDFVVEDWTRPKNGGERETMMRNAKISRLITINGYFLMFVMSVMKLAPPYIDELLKKQEKNDTATRIRPFPFQTVYIYDANKSPNYELTYLAQFVSSLYAVISYTGIDNFLAMLVLHACGQLENLNFSLENLAEEADDEKNRNGFQNKLTMIVERHLHLIRSCVSVYYEKRVIRRCEKTFKSNRRWPFVGTIEECFNLMLLVQLLAFSVIFCFQGYQLFNTMKINGSPPVIELVFLVVHVMSIMAHIFVYCLVGESLIIQSEGIHGAAYMCNWYNLQPKSANLLILLMASAKKPLAISAGKFCLMSLSTFADIVKTSVSYMSVLIAIKE